jgi:hypothetical protein
MFLGTDDAGEDNATFVSLLASCKLHALEPGPTSAICSACCPPGR